MEISSKSVKRALIKQRNRLLIFVQSDEGAKKLPRVGRPAAKGSREACKPPERTGVPYDEMWVYKEPITNHAG